MWEITRPVIDQGILDLSSSGQGPVRVSKLIQEERVIFNAVELIDWTSSPLQAIVCEDCGIPGCAPGGWIDLRSANGFVLLLPDFAKMSGKKRDRIESAPPGYFSDQSVPYLTDVTYNRLRTTLPQLPLLGDIPTLRTHEAISLLQFEAPYQMFGAPAAQFAYIRDVVVGVSDGDISERLNQIQDLAHTFLNSDTQVTLRQPTDDEEIVSFYVDSFDFVPWATLACSSSGCRLMIGSRFILNNGDIG
jgi:hypothetical protein